MTECNQSQFEFEAHFSRPVVAEFSGERLTTEGGALLLRAADRKIGLLLRPRAARLGSWNWLVAPRFYQGR